jgi:hypothetical protein
VRRRYTTLFLLASSPAVAAPSFAEATFAPAAISGEPTLLAREAADLLRWLAAHPTDPGSGPRAQTSASRADLVRTLEWIVAVEAEDRGRAAQRLADPAFLAAHLRFIGWKADREAAAARHVDLPDDRIRLTKYLAWEYDGRPTREAGFDAALYAVPDDDALRLKYTRSQVLDGVYEPGGAAAGCAKALAWLPRAQVHEALMQGTAVVHFPDGTEHVLNVFRNNGMPWDPALAREPEKQARLWYFREVGGLRGYGDDDKVAIEPQVTVAGDVADLGLGALVALRWTVDGADRVQLALLADTGSAFDGNLFQLDWLVGTYADRAAFDRDAGRIPDRVSAGILVLRDP